MKIKVELFGVCRELSDKDHIDLELNENSKIRDVFALKDSTRNKKKTDKYLRDTIIVTAHARNLGME